MIHIYRNSEHISHMPTNVPEMSCALPEILLSTIDRERFAGLNARIYNPIKVSAEILSHCLSQNCLLFSIIEKHLYSRENLIFAVLLKTVKNVNVQPSESFSIYVYSTVPGNVDISQCRKCPYIPIYIMNRKSILHISCMRFPGPVNLGFLPVIQRNPVVQSLQWQYCM